MPPLGVELYADFEEMARAREALDARLEAWTSDFTPAWLEAPFTYTSMADGLTRTLPTWKIIVHMFNHQAHHRGQLTTLLSQLGHDPGVTDLPAAPGVSTVHEPE